MIIMTHPIVSVTTADKLTLYGLLLEPPRIEASLVQMDGAPGKKAVLKIKSSE